MTRSILDIPRRFRPAFCGGYLVVQLTVLLGAQASPDRVFGFQMFNASSSIKISLFRKVRQRGRSRVVKVHDGTWQARDRQGVVHTYHWQDRVRSGVLSVLDHSVHASYGIEAQLFRLRLALADVQSHLPGDDETEALIAVVDTLQNGREAAQVRLEERRR